MRIYAAYYVGFSSMRCSLHEMRDNAAISHDFTRKIHVQTATRQKWRATLLTIGGFGRDNDCFLLRLCDHLPLVASRFCMLLNANGDECNGRHQPVLRMSHKGKLNCSRDIHDNVFCMSLVYLDDIFMQ